MTEEEFRNLQERVALIKEMAATNGWEVALDRARATMYQKQKQILQGRVGSWEEYRETVGWIEGVAFFMSIPDLVERELEVELENREEE